MMEAELIPPGRDVMVSLPRKRLPVFDAPRMTSIYYALGEVTIPGDYAEFGVYRGESARRMLAFIPREVKLHLFDSFEGLPENWLRNRPAGHFKLASNEIPRFNPTRTVVYKGWFKDTVPGFAKDMKTPLSFIHMDADLYSSTIDVLFNINQLILPGTILLFDEYVMGENEDEHRALCEWGLKFDRKFEYLWRSEGPQVCVRIAV